jgi:hypothetical protein
MLAFVDAVTQPSMVIDLILHYDVSHFVHASLSSIHSLILEGIHSVQFAARFQRYSRPAGSSTRCAHNFNGAD